MVITQEVLEVRKASLVDSLQRSEATYQDLKDRNKVIKKEISNTKGALIEIDRMLENLFD